MAQDTRFKAPDNDDFAAVDKKIAGWLAAQPGVQSTKIGENLDFGALNTRLKVIQNNLDNDLGNDPAKMLNDPKNADVKKAVLDYFKPADQHPTSSVQFLDQLEKIKNAEPLATPSASVTAPPAQAPVAPAAPALASLATGSPAVAQPAASPASPAGPAASPLVASASAPEDPKKPSALPANFAQQPPLMMFLSVLAALMNFGQGNGANPLQGIAALFNHQAQTDMPAPANAARHDNAAEVAAAPPAPAAARDNSVTVTAAAPPPIQLASIDSNATIPLQPVKQWDPSVTAKNAGGFDSRSGAFGSDVDLGQRGRLAAEIFQPTELANSQLAVNPSPTALPVATPAVQPLVRQAQQFALA